MRALRREHDAEARKLGSLSLVNTHRVGGFVFRQKRGGNTPNRSVVSAKMGDKRSRAIAQNNSDIAVKKAFLRRVTRDENRLPVKMFLCRTSRRSKQFPCAGVQCLGAEFSPPQRSQYAGGIQQREHFFRLGIGGNILKFFGKNFGKSFVEFFRRNLSGVKTKNSAFPRGKIRLVQHRSNGRDIAANDRASHAPEHTASIETTALRELDPRTREFFLRAYCPENASGADRIELIFVAEQNESRSRTKRG